MFLFDFSHRSVKVSPEVRVISMLSRDGHSFLLTRAVREPCCNAAQVILHTGDMRWHPRMGQHPALRGRRIDLLFMDTTYGLPKHVHPPQVQRTISSSVFPKNQISSLHLAAITHVGPVFDGLPARPNSATHCVGFRS